MERFDRWGTFGFDLGIYDQGTWLLSRFKDPFVTIRGLELFGHHANIFLLLLVPFYWLGAGPIFLLVVQVLAQASGAIAVFLLARDLLRSKWAGVVLAAALLLNPTYQWLTWEFFHPDAVAIGPLLFAYWAARSKRWRWFTVAAILAVVCKEDLAIAIAILGIIVAFRGDRRRGAIVAALSTAYFFFATRVLIPGQNGIGPFYDSFFGDLGKSPTEVAFNSVRHPTKTWDLANEKDRKNWYFNMFAPWAFVPLLDLRALAVAGGAIFINIVSSFPYTRDYRFHYSAIVVAGCAVATVEAIAWISNRAKQRIPTQVAMLSAVLTAAVVASFALGCAQYSKHYKDGTWPGDSEPEGCDPGRGREVGPEPGVGQRGLQHGHAHDPPARRVRVPGPVVQHQLGRARRAPRRPGNGAVPRARPDADQRPAGQGAPGGSAVRRVPDRVRELGDLVVAKRVRPPARPRGENPPEGSCFARPSLNRFQPNLQAAPERSDSACAGVDGVRVADLLASSGSTGRISRPAASPPPASGATRLQPRPA